MLLARVPHQARLTQQGAKFLNCRATEQRVKDIQLLAWSRVNTATKGYPEVLKQASLSGSLTKTENIENSIRINILPAH
jgi:hypothetical protein